MPPLTCPLPPPGQTKEKNKRTPELLPLTKKKQKDRVCLWYPPNALIYTLQVSLTFCCGVFQAKHLFHSFPRRTPHNAVPLGQGILRRSPQVELELDRLSLVSHVRENQLRHDVFRRSPLRAERQGVRRLDFFFCVVLSGFV